MILKKGNVIGLAKTTGRFFLLLLVFVFLFVVSCKKGEDAPQNDPTVPMANFKWSVDGGATVTASEAYFIAAYNNIVATKSGNAASIDMVLDDLQEGSHNISASTGITFEFVNSGITYTGESGVITISQNSGSLISGTFNAQLSGGTAKSITGSFSNIKEK